MANFASVGQTSFGTQGTQSSQFRARSFLDGERCRMLARRLAYYENSQHDYKRFDFDGRIISTGGGMGVTQPLLSAERAAYYVPLRSRRPSSPYRLPRVIVNSFTSMVFGDNRFPQIRVKGDSNAEDYISAMVKVMRLPSKMIRARNKAGSMGAVGLSWCFSNGKPTCKVHSTDHLFVHEWEDREECIPRHVTEVYQYSTGEEWDPQKRRYVRAMYWHRRDWTPNADIVFLPVKVEPNKDPQWKPDLARSEEHKDNLTHFVWIQNKPSEDIDGVPDYEGLYENFDTIDLLLSVIVRGATLNLDPTLKLKLDPDLVKRMGVRKGSDNALIVGIDGDADYLELEGTSLKAGIDLFNAKRRSILEVARCVILDPDEITANGNSSVAMKMLHSSMLGETDILREQFGDGLVRMLEPMLTIARMAKSSTVIITDADGNQEEVQREVSLPPKQIDEDVLDEDGNPTGEKKHSQQDRDPGDGGELDAEYGPYFPPTPNDQSVLATTLSTANGGQPFMSTQTATELMMSAFGRSAQDEGQRVAQEQQAQDAKKAEMFQPPGGQVGGPNQMPPGAGKKPPFPPKPPKQPKPPKPPQKGAGGTGTESSEPNSNDVA